MGELLDVRGVATWHEVSGSGEAVVLLHGGLTNGECFALQVPALVAAGWRVHVPDRRGHGRSPDTDAPFSYAAMAEETVAYLEDVVGGPAHLVGFSDGGNAAMLLAIARPDLVRRLVLMGSNFHHDGLRASDSDHPDLTEIGDADPVDAYLGSLYAAVSPDGPDHWPVVRNKTLEMFRREPTLSVTDLRQINAPTLVLVGDDDVIRLSHTVQLFEALPEPQLAVIPGASHMVLMEQPDAVNAMINSFLAQSGPPAQILPRRVGHSA